MTPTLTREQAKAFYDRFGTRLDSPMAYEKAPVDALVAHLHCHDARAVCEFGCGTGRLAERLLDEEMPAGSTYLGLDISETMVTQARRRLAGHAPRAEVVQTDGAMTIPAEEGAFDRVVSAYVLDLLSDEDIAGFLDEAFRCLAPGGLLGVVSLTFGETLVQRLAIGLWQAVYAASPLVVGGCRPLRLDGFLAGDRWAVRYRAVIAQSGIPSEVIVAKRL